MIERIVLDDKRVLFPGMMNLILGIDLAEMNLEGIQVVKSPMSDEEILRALDETTSRKSVVDISSQILGIKLYPDLKEKNGLWCDNAQDVYLPFSSLSTGTRQLLGLLSHILKESETPILLYYPETYLHPLSQRALGQHFINISLLANSMGARRQVFVHSWSPHIIHGCQIAMKNLVKTPSWPRLKDHLEKSFRVTFAENGYIASHVILESGRTDEEWPFMHQEKELEDLLS